MLSVESLNLTKECRKIGRIKIKQDVLIILLHSKNMIQSFFSIKTALHCKNNFDGKLFLKI